MKDLKDLILGAKIWVPAGFGVVLCKDNRAIFVTPDYSKLLMAKLADKYPNDPHLPKFKYLGQVDCFPDNRVEEGQPFTWDVTSLQPLDGIELDSLYVLSAPVYLSSEGKRGADWYKSIKPYLGKPYTNKYGWTESDFIFKELIERDVLVRETVIPESDTVIPKSILVSLARIVDMAKEENSDVVWDLLIEDNIMADEDGNLILNDLITPNIEYCKKFGGMASDVFGIG